MQPSGKPEPVQPVIGLYFGDRPATRTPSILRLGSQGIDIPPGDGQYVVEDRYTLPVNTTLLAVQPHAHYRAKDVIGDGDVARRHDAHAHPHRQLGLPLAARLPLHRADPPAERHDGGDEVRLRQLAGESAQSAGADGGACAGASGRSTKWATCGSSCRLTATTERTVLVTEVQAKMTAEDLIGLETMLLSSPDDTELHDDAGVIALLLGRPGGSRAAFPRLSGATARKRERPLQRGDRAHRRGALRRRRRQLRTRAPAAAEVTPRRSATSATPWSSSAGRRTPSSATSRP